MRETIRMEYVRCGKSGCRGCPHGPYYYAYWRENGKLRKRYLGKNDPREARAAEPTAPHPHDAIFNRSTATRALAYEILGLRPTASMEDVRATFKRLILRDHPDRGGDPVAAQRIIAARDMLEGRL